MFFPERVTTNTFEVTIEMVAAALIAFERVDFAVFFM
jgi:hypothetical protein